VLQHGWLVHEPPSPLQPPPSWQHADVKVPHVSMQFWALHTPGMQHWLFTQLPPGQGGQLVCPPHEFVITPHWFAPHVGVGHSHWLPTQFSMPGHIPQGSDVLPQEFVKVPHW
jgi:hypothetical protein